jgi:chemotaxis response regulator CheB
VRGARTDIAAFPQAVLTGTIWRVGGPQDRARVEVVALVASTGGLDALSAVLRGLSVDLPVEVVVQQHLGGQTSVLSK